MRKFLQKIGLWLALVMLLGGSSAAVNVKLLEFHRPPPGGCTTALFAGDSHAVTGFDPEAFPGSVNLAQYAEPLVATFYKLRYLEPSFPSLKLVVISLGPHNIAGFWDTQLQGDYLTGVLLQRYTGIAPWHRIPSMPLSIEHGTAALLRDWMTPQRHLLEDWIAQRKPTSSLRAHSHSNGFRPVDTTALSLDQLLEVTDGQFRSNHIAVSRSQPPFIDSIMNWAELNEVALIFVITPLHEDYRNRIPEPVASSFADLLRHISGSPYADLINLGDLALPDDYFADHSHVNKRGAAVVMTRLINHAGRTTDRSCSDNR